MIQKYLLAGLLCTAFTSLYAQDSTTTTPEEPCAKGLNVTGSLDVYYRYDFAKTKANNLTSFTNSQNSFELGMASVRLEQNFKNVSMVADIGFGKRAQDFSYNDESTLAAIKQLYISYAATDWLKFTAGSWATHVGYELVDPMPNRNYSMSYMFSYGPFFHTGIKAEITQGNHGFMVGITNPTDFKFVPDEGLNRKFFIAQYSYAPGDKFAAYLNFVSGQGLDSSKSNQIDLVMTTKLSEQFSLGYNGTVNTGKAREAGKFGEGQSWWGSALYINYDPATNFGLTLRNEYFSDAKSRLMFAGIPDGGSIFATTLSAQIKVGSCFTLIPEFRMDNASKNIFSKSGGAGTKSAANVLVAAVYSF